MKDRGIRGIIGATSSSRRSLGRPMLGMNERKTTRRGGGDGGGGGGGTTKWQTQARSAEEEGEGEDGRMSISTKSTVEKPNREPGQAYVVSKLRWE